MAEVRVVVPCWNAEAFVGEAVRSVLGQTLTELEVVVVDDGSTDGSLALLRSFRDPRVSVLEQSNRGVSAARNRGAEGCAAPFLAFLDADDLYLPRNLERKLAALRRDPETVLVHGDRIDAMPDGTERTVSAPECRGRVLEALLDFRTGVNGPSSAVVRTKAFREAGGFDPELSTSADRDLWIRLATLGPFEYLEEPLTRYRLHPGQMHHDIRAQEHDLRRIGDKIGRDPRIPAHLVRRFRLRVARLLAASHWHHTGRFDRIARFGLEYLLRRLRGGLSG